MKQVSTDRLINAPVDRVFDTIATASGFSSAVPHIVSVEMLSEQKRGVGTRFRETRLMRGKEAITELEVTEFVENDRVRFVSDAGGTIWDTVFTVAAEGDDCRLRMVMDARPHAFLARIVTPMIMGMVAKAVEADMDAIKKYCEGQAPS
jgi:uncharacterized membrane protein